MFILYDKANKEIISNMGTNSAFPNGDIPNIEIPDGLTAIRIPDSDPLVQKILNAHTYQLVLTADDELGDVIVTKTNEEYLEELPADIAEPTTDERIQKMQTEMDNAILELTMLIAMGGMPDV